MKVLTVLGMGFGMGIVGVEGSDFGLHFDFMAVAMRPRATTAVSLAAGLNLQTFTAALGGAAADPILSTGDTARPFSVDGDTFTDFPSASQRSCNNQHNACAAIANGGTNPNNITVGQCDTQQTSCLAVQKTAVSTAGVASSTAISSSSTSSTSTSTTSTTSVSVAVTTSTTAAAAATVAALQTVASVNENFFFICDL